MTHINKCAISVEQNVPETLCHYTSLESLANILQYRTIRLMPLTSLDDPQESRTADAPGIAMYYFVSCWTDDKTESIPMWNMYATLQSGVRIELVNDPFVRYEYSEHEAAKALKLTADHVRFGENGLRTFLPLEDIAVHGISAALLEGTNVLQRIRYTSNPDLLIPKTISLDDNGMQADTSGVAKYKNEYWNFQHEWRYVLNFLPMNPFVDIEDSEERFAEAIGRMISGVDARAIPFYDLHLREDAIRGMRIVPSPKMTTGNRILLNHLIAAHGLLDNVDESELVGLL